MELVVADQNDLDFIFSWLRAEEDAYHAGHADGADPRQFTKGFWCNRSAIGSTFEEGKLEVVRVHGNAVAFHFGEFLNPGITEVHPDFRGKGIGTAIVRQLLRRAAANEACYLHVKCVSDYSERFWSHFGFVPKEEFSEDYYLVLQHPQPLSQIPRHTISVNFFDESSWYTDRAPYKKVEIPCVVEADQILLSELCHDALIGGSKGSSECRVQVLLDGQVIFEDYLGSQEAEAFGFFEGKRFSKVAKVFNLAFSGLR